MAILNKKKELVLKSFEQRAEMDTSPIQNQSLKVRRTVAGTARAGQLVYFEEFTGTYLPIPETEEEKDEYNRLKLERMDRHSHKH